VDNNNFWVKIEEVNETAEINGFFRKFFFCILYISPASVAAL
jgi:hypothetical protein